MEINNPDNQLPNEDLVSVIILILGIIGIFICLLAWNK